MYCHVIGNVSIDGIWIGNQTYSTPLHKEREYTSQFLVTYASVHSHVSVAVAR
jgi:hypothetical protein